MSKTVIKSKAEVIQEYATKPQDTGSTEVQVAIMTNRINELTQHMEIHKKDFHSRQGLLMIIAKRRKLLDYIKRKDVARYKSLIERLGVRR